MIYDIKEVNFPDYATLSSAQVSDADMGEKVITTTIKINGSIVPDFSYDWVVDFNGERYIHPLRKPQASKDNTDIRSHIDLTFRHWAIVELQRYFFVEMASINSGTAIPNKYIADLTLNLGDFIDALNKVLDYWYKGRIKAVLHKDWQYAKEPTTITISNTHIWTLLVEQMYKLFGVRWQIVSKGDTCEIQFGYPTDEIEHIFEYGFKGGLLKVERQVQSDNISNIIIGRGGEKNVPYRYFKNIDPENPSFPADPDWIPELANIYFDRIRDAAFRSYVQGWKYKHYLNQLENSQYVDREHTAVDWAWDKGYNDEKFDPIEYVKDDVSIERYGEKWNALDDNEDIYPTIQGIEIDPFGRIDQCVAVGEVVTNEQGEETSTGESEISVIKNITGTATKVGGGDPATITIPIIFYGETKYYNNSPNITIPVGKIANFTLGGYQISARKSKGNGDFGSQIAVVSERVRFFSGADENAGSAIPSGTWGAEVIVQVRNTTYEELNVTVSYPQASIEIGESTLSRQKRYPNTFDIWVKNIWNTERGDNENTEDYADRVWKPILGNHIGDTARVVFATGWLSISEDYEFTIVKTPVYDTSKSLDGVPSHWRITLACSDADFDSLGVLVPNAQTHANAGDFFFFIGIDLPYLYYTEAEKRLTRYKQDELDKVKDIKPTWVVNLDKVRIGTKQFNDFMPLLLQLKAGATLRLTDPRFIAEKDKAYEELYIQSITYEYKEHTNGDPYIIPDVEIILSDSYTVSANPVALLQGDVSALQKQVGSISNIEQIVRAVCDRLYLRKDGIADLSLSPTKFNSLVTSKDFRIGNIGGAGWGIYRDANGASVIEADRAIIRQDMEVSNLVINQISAEGGMTIEPAARMEVIMVADNPDGYYCYFDQKQGSVANLFEVDDVAFNEHWDADTTAQVFYKRRVKAVGADYIVLTKGDAPNENAKGDSGVNGTGIPAEGDIIVHYGNYTNANRRYVKIRNVIGGVYERFLQGLDSVFADGEECWFVGKQGQETPRLFLGTRNDEQYIEFVNNKLHIPGSLILGSTYKGNTLQKYIEEVGAASGKEALEALDGYKYLKEATNQGTLVKGGLVLTSMIQLGMDIDGTYTVFSGINGLPLDDAKRGYGIAAWYGGDMRDGEYDGWTNRAAKSLFRFDGSGYLSGGAITWDNTGSGSVGNGVISWSSDGKVTLRDDIVLGTGDESLTTVLNFMSKFNNMFELDTTSVQGMTLIKAKYDGFYSNGFISALGVNPNGGGGGGSDYERLDAWSDYTSEKSGWVLSALLGYDLHTRVTDNTGNISSLTYRVSALEASGGDLSKYVKKSGDTMTGTLAVPSIELTGTGITINNNGTDGFAIRCDAGALFLSNNANLELKPGTGLTGQVSLGATSARWKNIYTTTIDVTSTALVSNLNADLLDSHEGTWYQKNVLTFQRVKNGSATVTINPDEDLDGGGIIRNYYGSAAWAGTVPTGIGWAGAILGIQDSTAALPLLGQFAWDITGKAWYRVRTASSFTAWKQIAFTDSNVATASALQTSRTLWGRPFNGTADVTGDMDDVGQINAKKIALYQSGTTTDTFISVANDGGKISLDCATNRGVYDSTNSAWLIAYNKSNGRTELNDGNVSIANTLTAARMVISSTTQEAHLTFSRSSANYIVASNASGTLCFVPGGGAASNTGIAMCIRADKSIGINNGANATSATLHVVGTIYSTQGIWSDSYVSALGQNTSSDARLKVFIADTPLTIEQIAKAPNVIFKWKNTGERAVGSIAQYWQKILPEAVSVNKRGYLEMQYGNIALASVITLSRKVLNHEERIAELERKTQNVE